MSLSKRRLSLGLLGTPMLSLSLGPRREGEYSENDGGIGCRHHSDSDYDYYTKNDIHPKFVFITQEGEKRRIGAAGRRIGGRSKSSTSTTSSNGGDKCKARHPTPYPSSEKKTEYFSSGGDDDNGDGTEQKSHCKKIRKKIKPKNNQ